MIEAAVISWWIVVNGANTPHIVNHLLTGDSFSDDTGQAAAIIPADPNAVICRLTCSQATLDNILADVPDYGPGSVMWWEAIVE